MSATFTLPRHALLLYIYVNIPTIVKQTQASLNCAKKSENAFGISQRIGPV